MEVGVEDVFEVDARLIVFFFPSFEFKGEFECFILIFGGLDLLFALLFFLLDSEVSDFIEIIIVVHFVVRHPFTVVLAGVLVGADRLSVEVEVLDFVEGVKLSESLERFGEGEEDKLFHESLDRGVETIDRCVSDGLTEVRLWLFIRMVLWLVCDKHGV